MAWKRKLGLCTSKAYWHMWQVGFIALDVHICCLSPMNTVDITFNCTRLKAWNRFIFIPLWYSNCSDCFWPAFQSSCIMEHFFLSYCKRAGEGQLLGAEAAHLNKLLFVSVFFEHRFFLLCLPLLEKRSYWVVDLPRRGKGEDLHSHLAPWCLLCPTKHLNHCSHRVHKGLLLSFVK